MLEPARRRGNALAGTGVLHERGLRNARIVRSRLTAALVAEAVARMPQPCRVVVSGPDGFNAAARKMLSSVMDDALVTVLSA